MYYGKIRDCDIANGQGVRVALFVSGCRNHCENCFQPETWDFNYGNKFDNKTEAYIINLLSRPYIKGLSVLGGEPMEPENQRELAPLFSKIKDELPDKNIWLYTGYTLEETQMEDMRCRCEMTDKLLSYVDVLVDGRFIEELKDISLRFRGSSNQRIIDMKKWALAGRKIDIDESVYWSG